MNSGIVLMLVYLVVTAIFQVIGFGVSTIVDLYDSSWSLLAFLVLFLSAFWAAWPAAVTVTNWLIPLNDTERAAAEVRIQSIVSSTLKP
jgi:hypothetical protein